MAQKKIRIFADCLCDLPEDYLNKNNVGIVYYYITTDTGRFLDREEISATNIFEYFYDGGKMATTEGPSKEEFVKLFTDELKEYDEIIHLALSSRMDPCFENSKSAAEQMGELGKRIHVFDTQHACTGMGHIVMRAVDMAKEGKSSEEIIADLTQLRDKVSTTFLAYSASYLAQNERFPKYKQVILKILRMHPVLVFKCGGIGLKGMYWGSYEKAIKNYVRSELKNITKIKKDKVFLTHAACTLKDVEIAKKETSKYLNLESVTITKACASIACNSGPRAIGLFFVKE